jgi:hypothetical protein
MSPDRARMSEHSLGRAWYLSSTPYQADAGNMLVLATPNIYIYPYQQKVTIFRTPVYRVVT